MVIVRKSTVNPLATILFFTYYFFSRTGWPTTLDFSMILYGIIFSNTFNFFQWLFSNDGHITTFLEHLLMPTNATQTYFFISTNFDENLFPNSKYKLISDELLSTKSFKTSIVCKIKSTLAACGGALRLVKERWMEM